MPKKYRLPPPASCPMTPPILNVPLAAVEVSLNIIEPPFPRMNVALAAVEELKKFVLPPSGAVLIKVAWPAVDVLLNKIEPLFVKTVEIPAEALLLKNVTPGFAIGPMTMFCVTPELLIIPAPSKTKLVS